MAAVSVEVPNRTAMSAFGSKAESLAIGPGLSLITSYDTEDRLCQFGSIGRLTLRIQRYGADGQNRNCQQPIHNALVALPS